MSYHKHVSAKNKTIIGILLALVIIFGAALLWAIATGSFEYRADSDIQLAPYTSVTPTPSIQN